MFISAILIGLFGYLTNKVVSKTLVKLFKNPFSKKSIIITQVIGIGIFAIKIILTFLLTQLTYNYFIKTPSGVFVEISLKNSQNIPGYVIYNSNVKSLKECEETFAEALPSIMKNLPIGIPRDSVATGWKCSLKDPAKENN